MRVSPERMSNEDKESLLSSQINCFGGNPERILCACGGTSVSNHIFSCKSATVELAESPSRLLRLPPLYWHLKTFRAKHPFINVIQLMEHEALRVESVCTKIYMKVQKKIICGFLLLLLICCVSSQQN